MAILGSSCRILAIFAMVYALAFTMAQAQSQAPAPAPTSDGTSVDQGIAYVLLMAALILTYLMH